MDWSSICAGIPILWEELLFFVSLRIALCYFLYHWTLLFGVNCVELGHSSISDKVKRPYWKMMYSFMSPMAFQFFCFLKVKMLNPVNFILLCHNGSSIFLFLTHVLFVFLFSTNKRYSSALHKTIKLCFYLSVVQFYFIFSLASRFVVISCYFCSLNGSLIWCEASVLNIQQNKKNKPKISLNLIFNSF